MHVLLFLLFCQTVRAQKSTISGRVQDTILRANCSFAVVALLSNDSTLYKFARCNQNGGFTLSNVSAGSYYLLVTHPSYAALTFKIIIDGLQNIEFGSIAMSRLADSLAPVTVTPGNARPRFRGDTLEFSVGHLKTRANASVEELLARLPGVKIQQDGVITVNGKKIERLLVDGEDIFGNDPSIISRNFNADMIAKVQVVNKKTDNAQFSGIDDGKFTTALNLTLKAERKHGYFIKAEAGGDTEGFHNLNGLLGSFKGRRQLVMLGMNANTGLTGFGGSVGGMGAEFSLGTGTNDPLGASAGTGIPNTTGGGIHYADKYNNGNGHLSGNYSYGRSFTKPISSFLSTQLLPGSVYVQQLKNNSVNLHNQHSLNIEGEFNPDSVLSLRLMASGTSSSGENSFYSQGQTILNDTVANSNMRSIRSNVSDQNARLNFMWKIRSRKIAKRSFSGLAVISRQANITNGFLYSLNNFYRAGSQNGADTIDQRKLISSSGLYLNSGLNFTEPLWKNTILGLSYGLSYYSSAMQQATYNKGDGKYDMYIDSLSSNFLNWFVMQRASASLQSQCSKYGYTVGGDFSYYAYKLVDISRDTFSRFHYPAFSPRLNAHYNINTYKRIELNYSGNADQLPIQQLQAVRNNNDPFHITIGNPGLRAGFTHSLYVGFHSVKASNIHLGLNYQTSTNAISTKTTTDSLGRQTSQPVNVKGAQSAGVYFTGSNKIRGLSLDVDYGGNISYTGTENYVNKYISKNTNLDFGGFIGISKFVPDKFSFQYNVYTDYTSLTSSISNIALAGYWTHSQNIQFSLYLIKSVQITSNVDFSWRPKLNNSDRLNSSLLWNAFLTKEFFDNKVSLRWQCNDILGQNRGISRNIAVNTITENNYNVIGRYWLLSATWRFIRNYK